jgi:hypothetical protein
VQSLHRAARNSLGVGRSFTWAVVYLSLCDLSLCDLDGLSWIQQGHGPFFHRLGGSGRAGGRMSRADCFGGGGFRNGDWEIGRFKQRDSPRAKGQSVLNSGASGARVSGSRARFPAGKRAGRAGASGRCRRHRGASRSGRHRRLSTSASASHETGCSFATPWPSPRLPSGRSL